MRIRAERLALTAAKAQDMPTNLVETRPVQVRTFFA
jgi:hypothetical protein